MIDADSLAANGWQAIPVSPNFDLLSFACKLGAPIPSRSRPEVVDTLIPEEITTRRSLSQAYGFHAFPLHTDMAYRRLPPRYVCLLSRAPSTVGTTFSDSAEWNLTHEDRLALTHEVWYVDNGRNKFLSPIMAERAPKQQCSIRFDRMCMRPALPLNRQRTAPLLDTLIAANRVKRIEWTEPMLVIFDNWRILHGRDAILDSDTGRRIERVCIAEPLEDLK